MENQGVTRPKEIKEGLGMLYYQTHAQAFSEIRAAGKKLKDLENKPDNVKPEDLAKAIVDLDVAKTKTQLIMKRWETISGEKNFDKFLGKVTY